MVRTVSAGDADVVALRQHVAKAQDALDSFIWDDGAVLIGEGVAAAFIRAPLHPQRAWVALAVAPDAGQAL